MGMGKIPCFVTRIVLRNFANEYYNVVKYGLLMLKSLERLPTKFVKYTREEIYELRTEYNGN